MCIFANMIGNGMKLFSARSAMARSLMRCFCSKHSARNFTQRLKECITCISIANETALEKKVFSESYQRIIHDVTSCDKADEESIFRRNLETFREILDRNVKHGELMHGLILIKTFKELKKTKSLPDMDVDLVHALAWSFEMARAFTNIANTITDGSLTRSKQFSWHPKKGVGEEVLNDSVIIQAGTYNLMRKYFRNEPYYGKLLEHMNEFFWETRIGHSLDIQFVEKYAKTRSLQPFTMNTLMDISRLKICTALYIPIALGMRLAGIDDPLAFTQAKYVCSKMAHFCKVQNDVMDSFGDPDETGKLGADIEAGKCSWLTVMAIELANNEQIKIIEENNGRKDGQCVQKMLDLFLELELVKLSEEHAQNTYDHIVDLVTRNTFRLPASIFLYCLHVFHRARKQ